MLLPLFYIDLAIIQNNYYALTGQFESKLSGVKYLDFEIFLPMVVCFYHTNHYPTLPSLTSGQNGNLNTKL